MAAALLTFVLAAEASGTGSEPDKLGGVAIIVGVVIVMAIVIGVAWLLLTRAARRNQRTVAQPEPHEEGQVGTL
jgi:nitrate reductase gamma subunit